MICIFYITVVDVAVHVPLSEGVGGGILMIILSLPFPPPFIPPPAGDTKRLLTPSK
jgi:hypothetical protein